jgi:hypothetical protein
MRGLVSKRMVIASVGLIAGGVTLQLARGQQIRSFAAQYLEGTAQQKQRAFSPAVITQGGKTVWLAGQTATEDLNHKSIVGDFDGQARSCLQLGAPRALRALWAKGAFPSPSKGERRRRHAYMLHHPRAGVLEQLKSPRIPGYAQRSSGGGASLKKSYLLWQIFWVRHPLERDAELSL